MQPNLILRRHDLLTRMICMRRMVPAVVMEKGPQLCLKSSEFIRPSCSLCPTASINLNSVIRLLVNPVAITTKRLMASRSINKEKKKGGKPKVMLTDSDLMQVIDSEEFKVRLKTIIERLKEDYNKSLNIRAGIGLEELIVDFDSQKYPLRELASISKKGNNLMVLNMASLPDAIKPAIESINNSGMNVNPQQEGTVIYIQLPKITREHRETLAKSAKILFNKAKEDLQKIQNAYINEAKMKAEFKGAGISVDLAFNAGENIRFITENSINECNLILEAKIKELLG